MNKTVIEFSNSVDEGGVESLVRDYAIMLRENAVNVIVLVLYKNENSANYHILKKNNIKVITIYNKWNFLNKVFNKLIGRFIIPFKLKKYIKKYNPKAIHIHQALLKYVFPLSELLNKKKIKVFYTCHSVPSRYFLGKNKLEFKAANLLIRKNRLQLIALHNEMANELNVMFNINNTIVLKNGIDFRKFSIIQETKQQAKIRIGISSECFVVGHIGRFADVKNHSFLIDVFEEIYKIKNNAFLLLVGAGELKEQSINKLNSLNLEGRYLILSNRSDIPQLLKAMDVFVFPSKYEGLPLTLVEAQVAGLKCVVSKNVSSESVLSEDTVQLELISPEIWAKSSIDYSLKNDFFGNLNEFNMCEIIKELVKLYFAD